MIFLKRFKRYVSDRSIMFNVQFNHVLKGYTNFSTETGNNCSVTIYRIRHEEDYNLYIYIKFHIHKYLISLCLTYTRVLTNYNISYDITRYIRNTELLPVYNKKLETNINFTPIRDLALSTNKKTYIPDIIYYY